MLKLPQALYDEVIAHCHREYPKEACGILAGQDGEVVSGGEARRAVEVYPMTNVEGSPIGYSMDPREQLALDKRMRARRQRLFGIYHSHTASDAYPSPVDVNLAISPDISYVVVSLKDRARPVVRSYTIDGAAIVEESLLLEDAPPGTR